MPRFTKLSFSNCSLYRTFISKRWQLECSPNLFLVLSDIIINLLRIVASGDLSLRRRWTKRFACEVYVWFRSEYYKLNLLLYPIDKYIRINQILQCSSRSSSAKRGEYLKSKVLALGASYLLWTCSSLLEWYSRDITKHPFTVRSAAFW